MSAPVGSLRPTMHRRLAPPPAPPLAAAPPIITTVAAINFAMFAGVVLGSIAHPGGIGLASFFCGINSDLSMSNICVGFWMNYPSCATNAFTLWYLPLLFLTSGIVIKGLTEVFLPNGLIKNSLRGISFISYGAGYMSGGYAAIKALECIYSVATYQISYDVYGYIV